MAQEAPKDSKYPEDVHVVKLGERQFILVGTAHVSQQSADLVREVIAGEQPDIVCVELDQQRYRALSEQNKWEALDLRQIIRQKQVSTLLLNLLLASYQRKLGDKLGVMPGAELLEATKVAKEYNIPLELCDRDVRVTLRRAWSALTLFNKLTLFSTGIVGAFGDHDISEETLEEIRKRDVLNELMAELGRAMPALKTVLIDERDTYLSQKMRDAAGERIVAVVGAGHVRGMVERLQTNSEVELAELDTVPPVSPIWKVFGWAIPVIILASIAYIGLTKGATAAGENAIFWFLANGIPSAIGAILAAGHPLTILAAFVSAPFTSLTPLIGAGYVAAFVQLYFQPPVVKELQNVSQEAGKIGNWWRNKLLRILLVFIFTSLGSVIGTYVGAYEIITNLF